MGVNDPYQSHSGLEILRDFVKLILGESVGLVTSTARSGTTSQALSVGDMGRSIGQRSNETNGKIGAAVYGWRLRATGVEI